MKKTFWGFVLAVVAFASLLALSLLAVSSHGPPAAGVNSPWVQHLSTTETLVVLCGIGLLGATAFVAAYQLLVGRCWSISTALLCTLQPILNYTLGAMNALRRLVPMPHFKSTRLCAD